MVLTLSEKMQKIKQDTQEADDLVDSKDNKLSDEDMILEAIDNENLEELLVGSEDCIETSEKEFLNIGTTLESPLKKGTNDKKENKKEKEKEKELPSTSTSTTMQASLYDAVTYDMQGGSNYKKQKIDDKRKRGKKVKSKPVSEDELEEEEEQDEEYEIESIVGHKLYKVKKKKYIYIFIVTVL